MGIKKHFTIAELKKLQPKEKRYDVWDLKQPKLVVTVTPSGSKTFYMVARSQGGRAGRVERVRIGPFPETKIEVARRQVSTWLNEMATGKNPAVERRKAREEMTLEELWEDYFHTAQRRKRSWRQDKYQYDKHLSEWKNRALWAITRSDVSRLAAKIERSGSPYAANRAVALLSSMWGWAERERGLELPNPCTKVKRNPEKPRDRFLTPDELRRFYQALMAHSVEDSRDALLLLLWTGQRKAVITGLRWREVDFRDEVLRIHPSRMKSDRGLLVPLAKPALEILERRRDKHSGKGGYVFPSHGKEGHLTELRVPLRAVLSAAEIGDRFTPHDLRRTWATYCRELGRDPAPVLGHAPQGVTERHYAMVTLSALRETVRATVAHILALATATDAKKAKAQSSNERS